MLFGIVLAGAAMAAEEGAYRYPFARGTVEKVDAASRRITVTTSGGERAFAVTDHTYYYRGKEKLALDRLKIGDSVKINYSTNETGLATINRLKVDLPEQTEERSAR